MPGCRPAAPSQARLRSHIKRGRRGVTGASFGPVGFWPCAGKSGGRASDLSARGRLGSSIAARPGLGRSDKGSRPWRSPHASEPGWHRDRHCMSRLRSANSASARRTMKASRPWLKRLKPERPGCSSAAGPKNWPSLVDAGPRTPSIPSRIVGPEADGAAGENLSKPNQERPCESATGQCPRPGRTRSAAGSLRVVAYPATRQAPRMALSNPLRGQ